MVILSKLKRFASKLVHLLLPSSLDNFNRKFGIYLMFNDVRMSDIKMVAVLLCPFWLIWFTRHMLYM